MRLLVFTMIFLAGCYRGTTSLAEAERKNDAAWVGVRLAHPDDGPAAALLLVKLAARGLPEARAVLANRLATSRPGPARDRLDAAVSARLQAGDAVLLDLHTTLARDERLPFRQAAARLSGAERR